MGYRITREWIESGGERGATKSGPQGPMWIGVKELVLPTDMVFMIP